MRVKMLIVVIFAAAAWSVRWSASFPSHHWIRFFVYLAAVLLSSSLKVAMPRRDGTMSVNFPFILLGIIQFSPGQAMALAALSVAAQCRIKVVKTFTFVQIAFNIANVMVSTAIACCSVIWASRMNMEPAPALALAAVAYFFANTIPVASVIAWSSGQALFRFWRQEFPWYLPFYLVGAVLASVTHLISQRFGWMTSLMLVPVIYTIYRAYRSQMTGIAERQRHLEETEALHFRTIEALAMAIEAKDQNTHDHLIRVRVYVSRIGKAFGMPKAEMKALETAAFLHDIGKLAVPEHIINKPGKLTPAEFEKIKIHPVVGADILERVRFPYPVVPIVRSHHEAWDGSGYPDGLKGEEIPLGARILTVVDCFDALASDRPYRKALPLSEAMAFLKQSAGIQFDPHVIEVLEQCYVELEEQARKQGEEIAPLKTDISVARGMAPGAGFEMHGDTSVLKDEPGLVPRTTMSLIAAASQEAQALHEISQMAGAALSASETASVMSSRLRTLIAFDCFALYLLKARSLSTHYMDGHGARCFSAEHVITPGEGLSGWVAQSGKSIVNGNPLVEPNYRPAESSSSPMISALSLPLITLTGEVFGVLTLYSATQDAYTSDHLRILQAIELKFSLSLQHALQPCHAAQNDPLDQTTQLPNMQYFFQALEAEVNRASRLDQKFALVVCSLVGLAAVSDRQGHLVREALLQAIAQRLVRCCRSYDILARLGANEFVLLLPGVDRTVYSRQLEAVDAAVKAASLDLKIEVEVTASLGVAFFPEDGATAEELIDLANRRMYARRGTRSELTATLQQREAVTAAVVA